MYNQNQLKHKLEQLGLDNLNNVIEKISIFIDILKKWNKKINLTSKSFDVENHIESSLLIYSKYKTLKGKLLDIGSGNGFPAIILSIIYNNSIELTMVEPNNKKCTFLREVCYNLAIHARVLNDTIENLPNDALFDYITMRGLKCTKKMEAKIDTLLNDSGFLFIWGFPSPTFTKFILSSSINQYNKYFNIYTKAPVAPQPK